jgi:hypothetical protein
MARASDRWAEHSDDVVVQLLLENGIPITRRNYLDLAYPDGLPEWGAELEAELPRQLQRGF